MKIWRAVLAIFLVALASGCEEGKLGVDTMQPSSLKSGERVMLSISGSGFEKGARVWLGASECPQVIFNSAQQLIALVPESPDSGELTLRVENPDGQSATLENAVNVKSGLSLTSLRPKRMIKKARKVEVVIKGKGMNKGCKVYFNTTLSPRIQFKSSSVVIARAPRLPPGIHDVKVVNPDGSEAVLYKSFQVSRRGQRGQLHEMEATSLGTSDRFRHQRGIAVADVNGDGLLDFFLTSSPDYRLFLNKGEGEFENVFDKTGIQVKGASYAAYFADYNNDGLPDLLVTGTPAHLFRNLGGLKFEEVSKQMGIDRKHFIFSATWGDYNADGFLDLYLGSAKANDFMYRNTGERFERVFPDLTEKMSFAQKIGNQQPSSFSCVFADYDNDGYCDLFTGIRAQPSLLLHNRQGEEFKNVIESSGVVVKKEMRGKDIYNLDWGSAFGDVNNDGLLDLLSTSGPIGLNLYINKGEGTFQDITDASRLRSGQSALCPAWGDFDNDGYLDVAISDNLSGTRVYRNQGDGSFRDVTSELGLMNAVGDPMGIVWADLNQDGALDLIMSNFMGASEYYLNTPYAGRHWLEIKLRGTRSNRMGIGSRVTVFADDRSWTRHVSGGEGYLSHPPAVLHFGLGEKKKVDRVEVVWPGGERQQVDEVEIDTLLEISQPEEPPRKEDNQ